MDIEDINEEKKVDKWETDEYEWDRDNEDGKDWKVGSEQGEYV